MQFSTGRIATYLSYFLIIAFWPLNFILHNPLTDLIHFFLPSLLVAVISISGGVSLKEKLIFCLIPLINSSLLFTSLAGFISKPERLIYILLTMVAAALVIWFSFKPFLGSSIFYFSHDDQQKIIRQGYLYPNVWLSRTFQNKPSIYMDRILFNFFALVDPNNYFFGFHPGEIAVENQNLQKFPFLAILFFGIGLYNAATKNRRLLVILFLLVLNLALLKNFDKTDAILWLPFAILIISGFQKLINLKFRFKFLLMLVFLLFTITEYLHMLVNTAVNL